MFCCFEIQLLLILGGKFVELICQQPLESSKEEIEHSPESMKFGNCTLWRDCVAKIFHIVSAQKAFVQVDA